MKISCPVWGSYELYLEFPFSRFLFTGLSEQQFVGLSTRFSAYTDTNNTPALHSVNNLIRFEACRLDSPVKSSVEEMSRNNFYTPVRKREGNRVKITGFDFMAQFRVDHLNEASKIGVYLEADLCRDVVIENVLRTYAAYLALKQGGVVLHSAGFVVDDQGFIFVGRSGAGKTTLTRKSHAAGATVLSDDINLLLPKDNTYQAHAVPFSGEFGRTLKLNGSNTEYPIKALCFLSQGKNFSVNRIDRAKAFAKLLVGSPYVNMDESEYDRLSDNLMQLLERCEVFDVKVSIDDPVDTIVEAILKKTKKHE